MPRKHYFLRVSSVQVVFVVHGFGFGFTLLQDVNIFWKTFVIFLNIFKWRDLFLREYLLRTSNTHILRNTLILAKSLVQELTPILTRMLILARISENARLMLFSSSTFILASQNAYFSLNAYSVLQIPTSGPPCTTEQPLMRIYGALFLSFLSSYFHKVVVT